jgi:hypothetical protein
MKRIPWNTAAAKKKKLLATPYAYETYETYKNVRLLKVWRFDGSVPVNAAFNICLCEACVIRLDKHV